MFFVVPVESIAKLYIFCSRVEVILVMVSAVEKSLCAHWYVVGSFWCCAVVFS